MSCGATGKVSMSRVSLRLLLWDLINCYIYDLTMSGCMVVVATSSYLVSPGLMPQWR